MRHWRKALLALLITVVFTTLVMRQKPSTQPSPKGPAMKSDEVAKVIVEAPQLLCLPSDMLPIYVITGPNTKDFPGRFTVRRQQVGRDMTVYIDKEPIGHGLTLEEARKLIPEGLSRLNRDPNDDPVIVESWL